LHSIRALENQFKEFSGYGFYERIINGISEIKTNTFDDIIEKTLFYIKKKELDKVVLLPLSLNENQIALEWQKRAPEVFIPFYNPPERRTNVNKLKKEMESSIIQNSYKGLKITSTFRRKFLNDKMLIDIFEIAQKYKLLILMHTGYPPPGTKKNVLSYSNPLYVEEIIQSFPNLKVIIAHMGYPWVDLALSLAVQYPNIFLDISNLTYMMPNRLKDFLKRAKELIGLDKILFGSDGFIPEMIQFSVDLFENIDYLSNEEIKKIMGLNAQKLLNL
jgi:predicted TIM-barrel fold metal-dependent hydrolase